MLEVKKDVAGALVTEFEFAGLFVLKIKPSSHVPNLFSRHFTKHQQDAFGGLDEAVLIGCESGPGIYVI